MLVLPDIYVLKTESIQKKTFLEDNLNKKLDEKNINNENFDKNFLIKIDDLDLPIRVLNFLKTENINYVGELIQYTEKDILSFPNSGRKSLQEIKYELSQINLTLGITLLTNILYFFEYMVLVLTCYHRLQTTERYQLIF